MFDRIIIKSIGRSGSHMVRKHLIKNKFKDCEYHPVFPIIYDQEKWKPINFFLKDYSIVVHTHSVYIPENSIDWICVFVERKSFFDVICSRLIVDKTNEYTNYTNITLEPFVADISDFEYHFYNDQERLSRMRRFIYNSKWKKIIHLYYEDIIQENYLQEKLPYIGNFEKEQYNNFQKSPFSATKYILNYSLLLDKYNELIKLL